MVINMDDSLFTEDRGYFGRQKPFDEYAIGVLQDTYERKLNNIIESRDKSAEVDCVTEIKELVCSPKRKRGGYFSAYSRRR
jgi:hypothetical protein